MLLLLCVGGTSSWANTQKHPNIDAIADHVKDAVDELGNDIDKIQAYLEKKMSIADQVIVGLATLSHLQLNGHHKIAVVKPGEKVEGTVDCHLDRDQCSALGFYRVVLGLKHEGPQTSICNCLGAAAGDSKESFSLTAPEEPGIYQIRFRVVESLLESTAFMHWKDENGHGPDATTTIGLLVVKR